ncbi:MAG: tetratricopeptide repeat protein [Myxococcota bacterium]
MADVLAIVSAAVFRKARTAEGGALGLRRVYPTDRYASSHKVLRAKLTGDLYLVTVTDDRLWLVAVLRRPVHDGQAWVSPPNVQPIVDLTSVAGELRFDTGTGLDAEKMASSLQTPRGLTASDAAVLQKAIAAAAADRATPAAIEAAVVRVTAAILGRTEEQVRSDPGQYAAFHWDDGFLEEGLEEIDWSTLVIDPEPGGDLYGRRDFDLRRSRFHSDALRPTATTDDSLRGLLRRQDGYLYGEQLSTLIAQKRLRLADLDCWQVDGRISGGGSLVEVMTALLMLRDFDEHRLEPGEYNETSPRWAPLLEGIEPPGLRGHLSFFFQTADAARCTGACLTVEGGDDEDEDEDEDEWEEPDEVDEQEPEDDGYERVAEWWIGEGQGQCELVRIVDDRIAPVPPFTRHSLIRRPPRSEGDRPPTSGRSDEITSKPVHEALAELSPGHPLRRRLTGTTEAAVRAELEALRADDPDLYEVLGRVDSLIRQGRSRTALGVVGACAAVVDPDHALAVEYHRCWALFTLRCWPEALVSAERTLALWVEASPIPESNVHNNLAWCALHMGQLDRALEHADRAVALDPENGAAQGTRADVLFALGKEKAALKIFERLMRDGVDPEPTAAASAHPDYRKLALKYRMPVELTDREAAELESAPSGGQPT